MPAITSAAPIVAVVFVARFLEEIIEYAIRGGTISGFREYLTTHFAWHRFAAIQIWTSTMDQAAGLAAQERDLTAAGAERIFGEQVSSVAKRVKLAECLAFMRQGDVLTVTKPDRLARSTAELLSIEADLSKRGIGLVVLSMGGERLDTRNPTSKLMLTILAGVATWERERVMLERQREGIAKAKAAGKGDGARCATCTPGCTVRPDSPRPASCLLSRRSASSRRSRPSVRCHATSNGCTTARYPASTVSARCHGSSSSEGRRHRRPRCSPIPPTPPSA